MVSLARQCKPRRACTALWALVSASQSRPFPFRKRAQICDSRSCSPGEGRAAGDLYCVNFVEASQVGLCCALSCGLLAASKSYDLQPWALAWDPFPRSLPANPLPTPASSALRGATSACLGLQSLYLFVNHLNLCALLGSLAQTKFGRMLGLHDRIPRPTLRQCLTDNWAGLSSCSTLFFGAVGAPP